MYSLIVLASRCGGIAKAGGLLPFKNPTDMRNFAEKTTGNVVIMGRRTWESLPRRPLSNRINVIISSSVNITDKNMLVYRSIDECVRSLNIKNKECFVIGGESIFNKFLEKNMVSKIYYTEMNGTDRYIKKIGTTMRDLDVSPNWRRLAGWQMTPESLDNKRTMESVHADQQCRYGEYAFHNVEEQAILDQMRNIIETGYKKSDRTGTGTLSVFSPKDLVFNLDDHTLPLLTTRALPLRHIFEELMWILRGQTDAKILQKKGVHIWDANSSRDFLNRRGLRHYPTGDIGAGYGFQFRHFGAKYFDCLRTYTAGFDQLAYIIHLLRTDPDSRRIMVNLWNPMDIKAMSLTPCGFCYQFYVAPGGRLITKLTQRSSDIAVAGGWNIASAALLTHMLASVCGLQPHKLIWSVGDSHIYNNQIDDVREQLARRPSAPFPKLYFRGGAPSLTNGRHITEFEYDDLKLVNYRPQKKIKFAFNP